MTDKEVDITDVDIQVKQLWLVLILDGGNKILAQDYFYHVDSDWSPKVEKKGFKRAKSMWDRLVADGKEPANWMLEIQQNKQMCMVCRGTFILGLTGVGVPVLGEEILEVPVCDKDAGVKRTKSEIATFTIANMEDLKHIYYDPISGTLVTR